MNIHFEAEASPSEILQFHLWLIIRSTRRFIAAILSGQSSLMMDGKDGVMCAGGQDDKEDLVQWSPRQNVVKRFMDLEERRICCLVWTS